MANEVEVRAVLAPHAGQLADGAVDQLVFLWRHETPQIDPALLAGVVADRLASRHYAAFRRPAQASGPEHPPGSLDAIAAAFTVRGKPGLSQVNSGGMTSSSRPWEPRELAPINIEPVSDPSVASLVQAVRARGRSVQRDGPQQPARQHAQGRPDRSTRHGIVELSDP